MKINDKIYNDYLTTKASFERFKIYFGEVAYHYLNGLEYFDWNIIPTCHDMVRLCRIYESLKNKLNTLYKEWCKHVKLNYSNE